MHYWKVLVLLHSPDCCSAMRPTLCTSPGLYQYRNGARLPYGYFDYARGQLAP
jgi:hypothetical protein